MPLVLSAMSDFESTFLQEYSWLQRSCCILLVKAVMTPLESSLIQWAIKTKQATHTHYRFQTADIFLIKTEKQDTPQYNTFPSCGQF